MPGPLWDILFAATQQPNFPDPVGDVIEGLYLQEGVNLTQDDKEFIRTEGVNGQKPGRINAFRDRLENKREESFWGVYKFFKDRHYNIASFIARQLAQRGIRDQTEPIPAVDPTDGGRIILMLGETGSGKSCNGNLLLVPSNREGNGWVEHFTESSDIGSETSQTLAVTGEFDDLTITVIDTPGLSDSRNRDRPNIEAMVEFLIRYSWVHLILLTFNFKSDRVDANIQGDLRLLSNIFPTAEFWSRVVILFTKVEPSRREAQDPENFERKVQNRRMQIHRCVQEITGHQVNGVIFLDAHDPTGERTVSQLRLLGDKLRTLEFPISTSDIQAADPTYYSKERVVREQELEGQESVVREYEDEPWVGRVRLFVTHFWDKYTLLDNETVMESEHQEVAGSRREEFIPEKKEISEVKEEERSREVHREPTWKEKWQGWAALGNKKWIRLDDRVTYVSEKRKVAILHDGNTRILSDWIETSRWVKLVAI